MIFSVRCIVEIVLIVRFYRQSCLTTTSRCRGTPTGGCGFVPYSWGLPFYTSPSFFATGMYGAWTKLAAHRRLIATQHCSSLCTSNTQTNFSRCSIRIYHVLNCEFSLFIFLVFIILGSVGGAVVIDGVFHARLILSKDHTRVLVSFCTLTTTFAILIFSQLR